MGTLRGGLIGAGHVSRFHLAAWARQTLGRLVAVCDVDLERARAAARRHGIPAAYASAEEMLETERLDLVDVCTRPDAHEALVALAAWHRVAVMCQKPVAADLATIDRMIAVTDEAGVRLMVHENWRFRPWYVAMAAALGTGAVGRPLRLHAAHHEFRCLAPGGLAEQPYFATMPRLILYEMGPHLVDVARHLFGDPASVYGVTAHAGPQAGEDSAHLVLRYADGRLAILDASWATAEGPDQRAAWGLFPTAVEGTEGTLRTDADGQLRLERPDGAERRIPVALDADPREQSYAATIGHFLAGLATGRPFATDIRDQRRAMAIVFAGYESAATGAEVRLVEREDGGP